MLYTVKITSLNDNSVDVIRVFDNVHNAVDFCIKRCESVPYENYRALLTVQEFNGTTGENTNRICFQFYIRPIIEHDKP